jgi:heptosyltransferase-1
VDEALRRILLVRTSALGDVVHCLPVLTALRRHLPEARIAWVVEEAMAPLLAGHPDLDRTLPVRLRPWRHAPLSRRTREEARQSVAALKDFSPDVALDLMGNHKGALLAALSGAPRVVGLARRHCREPSSALWINRPVVPKTPAPAGPATAGPAAALHAVDRGLALLTALGLPAEPADFAGPRLLPGAAPPPDADERPYVALHPGAGWGNKIYPPRRWGEVARHLADAAGVETRVTLAPGEEHLAQAVATASGGAARPVPAADLATLAGLLRGARLVLGGDTGPLHLAHALGAPVLLLHGPTDPRRHGPYGAPGRALWEALPCSFCYKRFEETKACLLTVPADRVARRALDLLAGTGSTT